MKTRTLAITAVLTLAAYPSRAQPRPDPPEARLQRLPVEVDAETALFAAVRLVGLQRISADDVWAVVAPPPAPFAFAEAAALLERLERTEAFARVEPRLRLHGSDLTLEVRLEEHPLVRQVVIEGVSELSEEQLVAELLGAARPVPEGGAPARAAWLAHPAAPGTLEPGLLLGGLGGAVRRLMSALFDAGYRMADVSGRLSADGVLTLTVDEGRLEQVRIVGPTPSLHETMLASLDLPAGRTFLEADVREALQRLRRELPFVRPQSAARLTRGVPQVQTTPEADGGVRFGLRETEPVAINGPSSVEGRTLTLHFEPGVAVRFRLGADELLRHTPVGGIGIGIRTDTRLWDPRNRVHLRLETFSGSLAQETLDRVGEDAGEYDIALRLRVPALRLADVSLESYGMLETPDRWRVGRHTSYLNSLVADRPDSEYYYRQGHSFSVTVQPASRLLLGATHLNDRHRSLPSLRERHSLIPRDARFVNPPIDEGRVGSLVLSAELLSDPVRPEQIRGLFRSPDTTSLALTRGWGMSSGYHMLASVELARPALGSDTTLGFTRVVSDSMLFLATGADSGLRLRARLAGGSNLPLQKQEALGGWSALRGYSFKEFRGGDRSWLAMVEYRRRWLTGFVDIGSLHRRDAGWSGPHVGAGAKLHVDSLPVVGPWLKGKRLVPPFYFAAAWRLDGRLTARPELRLLVGHLF